MPVGMCRACRMGDLCQSRGILVSDCAGNSGYLWLPGWSLLSSHVTCNTDVLVFVLWQLCAQALYGLVVSPCPFLFEGGNKPRGLLQ